MSPAVAEFVGTAVLILLGDGVVANVVLTDTKGHNSGWMVITTAWALAVFVGVVIAGPASGAHLSPAVTVGLAVAGKFAWALVPKYIAAQFAGGFVGAVLVWVLYKDHFDRTSEAGLKLAVFCTGPAIRNHPLNLLNEIIGTAVLVLTVFYIAGAEITSTHTPVGLGSVGALPVALVVWVIGLGLGGTTGYALNPARDLAPRLAHAVLPIRGKGTSEWGYAWIPVVGPLLGAILAAVLYGQLG
ncbi:MIP/aquaporin family protein [Hymenobacter sp. GOD-10R]|uniref:MIP/aquaporin family protein n=1 Tax=Hymenobacter sp. GOD-10R TaxID=3093922 RepID=UPI002D78F615|nr:MIP/aquaporin family protein [Hymenobacter sp. GOD-10R]WRQ31324.1 MIP/aquaporin family protein [Hymenobacter sp. GOD-10R]